MASKRILYVIRHAKSSWDYGNISDLDRPLKIRGIRNAYEMARRLKINRNIPERFISSPANRAMHTASIFLNVFEKNYEALKIDSNLYGGGTEKILKVVKKQAADVKKIAIFGHNPDFSYLMQMFSREAICELPTCGMAIFTFNCDNWRDIAKESLVAESVDFPNKE